MKQTYTSSTIVSPKGFDGKTTEYMCELTIQPLNEEQFQIVQFSTQDLELNKMCLETFHKLSDENIIYSPNEIKKLTHNNNNIRPIKEENKWPLLHAHRGMPNTFKKFNLSVITQYSEVIQIIWEAHSKHSIGSLK